MTTASPLVFHWFRRDLRLEDNAALYAALSSGLKVLPVFIFDTHILDRLEDRADARLHFIHRVVAQLQERLQALDSTLLVESGSPLQVWKNLLERYPQARAVYAGADYERYALERDGAVRELLQSRGMELHTVKEHVVFDGSEVRKKDGTPYSVFTPYSKAWLERLRSQPQALNEYDCTALFGQWYKHAPTRLPLMSDLGFEPQARMRVPDTEPILDEELLRRYGARRDFPAEEGTSRLGVHLRFGTLSVRRLARLASETGSTVFLNELIWRDFYSMILQCFPHVERAAFRPGYERIAWLNRPEDFDAWCKGATGYPLVDAGMRQLNATGYMHNRVRMVVASFLCKHLLIDWRWGEAYFAAKLLDFDLASNNGGWQWAAGCGTDAAPYFRIFNPSAQAKKFDPKGAYCRRWLLELKTPPYDFPRPIVEHEQARKRCLETYKQALTL